MFKDIPTEDAQFSVVAITVADDHALKQDKSYLLFHEIHPLFVAYQPYHLHADKCVGFLTEFFC